MLLTVLNQNTMIMKKISFPIVEVVNYHSVYITDADPIDTVVVRKTPL